MLVDEKRWIDEQRFLHALNFCMLLPGPEAMQLATYARLAAAWLARRADRRAAVRAARRSSSMLRPVDALCGLRPAAAGRERSSSASRRRCWPSSSRRCCGSARRALEAASDWWIAAAAFAALFALQASRFRLIILRRRALARRFCARRPRWRPIIADAATPAASRLSRTALTAARAGGSLWLAPGGAADPGAWIRTTSSAQLALFFSKLAVVTFGGAYAVLAYMAQQAVETYRLAERRARCSMAWGSPKQRRGR